MTTLRTPRASRASTLLASLLLLGWACGDGGGARGPNVLLITLDTTRADRLGCYGYESAETPNLDGLAAEGARFARTISTAGITPMSHSSILTGLNNYRHGMRVFHSDEVSHSLKDSVDTLPEILQRRGYRTSAHVSAYPVSDAYNLDQGFDHFDAGVDIASLDLSVQQKHETTWDTGGRSSTQRRGDLTVDTALAWLDDNGDEGDPWCMWVHMFDVHDFSIVPPADFAARYGITYPAPGSARGGPAGDSWRERMYDPELAWMDAQVGRLLAWLRAKGQSENTIIVVTADHGQGLEDGFSRHGWRKHRLLYDWCLHVPLIVRIPGEQPAVVEAQTRTIDVLPTILEAAATPLTAKIEGRSLLPLIRGEVEPEPRIAYADALNLYDTHSPKNKLPAGQNDNLYCVTDGRWKLIWHEQDPSQNQLFDLANDPLEQRNVASANAGEVQRLKRFLDDNGAMKVERPGANSGGPSAAALNNLGYGGGDTDEDQ